MYKLHMLSSNGDTSYYISIPKQSYFVLLVLLSTILSISHLPHVKTDNNSISVVVFSALFNPTIEAQMTQAN